MNGKLYQKTREHLKPRTKDIPEPETPAEEPPFTSASEDYQEEGTQAAPIGSPTKATTPARPVRQPEETPSVKPSYQLRSQTTRAGRTTQVPAKFKD